MKALTYLISTNWFSTLDSIYYRQYTIQAALWNIYSSVISDLNFTIDYSTSNFTLPSISLLSKDHHHDQLEQEPEVLSLFIIRQCCESDNEVLISVFIRSALKYVIYIYKEKKTFTILSHFLFLFFLDLLINKNHGGHLKRMYYYLIKLHMLLMKNIDI